MRFCALLLCCAAWIVADAQSKVYYSHEDFFADKGEVLDTVYVEQHGKSRQLWWGGNDYKLTTGDSQLDKEIKKNAFAVVTQGDSIYVNCRNLRLEKTGFGNGYTRGMRIGEHSILIVNRLIGHEMAAEAQTASFLLGAMGGMAAASKSMKQQMCYVISSGADQKGRVDIRMVDESLIKLMLKDHPDVYLDYLQVTDKSKRNLASRVIPLLTKAGLLK